MATKTINPNLTRAFATLNRRGYIAGCFGGRGDDGWALVYHEATLRKAKHKAARGGVFYSEDALKNAEKTGEIFLQFGPIDRFTGDEAFIEVATVAVEVLRLNGCVVRWPGRAAACIVVENATVEE